MSEKTDSNLDIVFPAVVAGTVGMIGGLGVDYTTTNPNPTYEQTVELAAAAHAVTKMQDAKNMSPAEVYTAMQEYNKNAAKGLGLGVVGGAGAGYAARRRKEKKEAEATGNQVS